MGQKLPITCFFALVLCFVPFFADASSFRDIPATHFAYDAVNFAKDPANGAFMVGDIHGNFNPRRHMNMFEASRVFALAAGFRNPSPGLAPERLQLQESARELFRPFLEFMSNEYGRWNTVFDAEVAYLLYRGILKTDEAGEFISLIGSNESINFLTLNDASVWTLRMLGEQIDEAELLPQNLNRNITRAELAVILYEALYTPTPFTPPEADVNQLLDQINRLAGLHLAPGNEDLTLANLDSVSGRILAVRFDALSSVTIQTQAGRIHTVYVPGNVYDVLRLRVGMLVWARLEGNRAVEFSVWGSTGS